MFIAKLCSSAVSCLTSPVQTVKDAYNAPREKKLKWAVGIILGGGAVAASVYYRNKIAGLFKGAAGQCKKYCKSRGGVRKWFNSDKTCVKECIKGTPSYLQKGKTLASEVWKKATLKNGKTVAKTVWKNLSVENAKKVADKVGYFFRNLV